MVSKPVGLFVELGERERALAVDDGGALTNPLCLTLE